MPTTPLKSAPSALNSNVTLFSLPDPGPSKRVPSPVKEYTTLRRTTRSARSSLAVKPDPEETSIPAPASDLSKYAHQPTTTPPRKRVKIELDEDELKPIVPNDEDAATPKSKQVKSKPLPQLALEKAHPEPAKWKEQYRLIERMRKGIIAPVDDMGCERPQTISDSDPRTRRFHILISLMLSSQTKDAITSQAVTNLHSTLPDGLTAFSLAQAEPETVSACINKVGFWRRKTEYIQDAAKALLAREGDEHGDVPKTLEGLCALRGVGPKMAFLALQCAWDINAGIGVDVHVHRITNRLKWHKPPTQNAEQTRLNLQSWLPPTLHKSINPLLVGFGQIICLPVGPRCDLCLLGQAKMCPSRVAGVTGAGRKEVVYTFTAEGQGDEGTIMKVEGEGVDGEGVVKMDPEGMHGVKFEIDVLDGPLAKVEVGYEQGPLVKLEPGVADGL